MMVKVLMVAELEVRTRRGVEPDQEALEALDLFRESVLPQANYGITLSSAQAADLFEFAAHSSGEPSRPVRFAGEGPFLVYGS